MKWRHPTGVVRDDLGRWPSWRKSVNRHCGAGSIFAFQHCLFSGYFRFLSPTDLTVRQLTLWWINSLPSKTNKSKIGCRWRWYIYQHGLTTFFGIRKQFFSRHTTHSRSLFKRQIANSKSIMNLLKISKMFKIPKFSSNLKIQAKSWKSLKNSEKQENCTRSLEIK